MSYQDPNQASFGAPQQQGQQAWGQQSQPQGSWGQPGSAGQASGQSWGAPQGQIPQQPNYGAPGYGQPGQPQDFNPQQQYGQPGYLPQSDFGSGGYGQPGYPMGGMQQNSKAATWALWLGILGGWGIINLVVSIVAISETGPGKKLGRNKAVTGLILTLVWAAVWIGVTVAVTSHAKAVVTTYTNPITVATTTADGGSTAGAGGLQATGAGDDAGCQAAQTAYNTYESAITANSSNSLTAMQTLGNAFVAASDQSQVAGTQLKTVGNDFLSLAGGNAPASMVTDMEALDTACGMTFAAG
ncbi:MAG TPA: hypothetical protein VFN97_20300 [Actinospica sp.]|nr:hypothetical protein [Actinospica sp.]